MPPHAPEARRVAAAAALALGLMLVVVAASAYIRFGTAASAAGAAAAVDAARIVHRASATLALLAVLALATLAWRARVARAASLGALAAALALSVLGAATGSSPPPLAAAGNLLGGLALAAMLAWALGRARSAAAGSAPAAALRRSTARALGLAFVQAGLGAQLAAFGGVQNAYWVLLHAIVGVSLATVCSALAARLRHAGVRGESLAILVPALLAPLAGTVSALLELAPLAGLAHPLCAALLVVSLAQTHARLTA